MTQDEWEICENPRLMLGFLSIKASERKLRLFASACARDLLAYNPTGAVEEACGGLAEYQAAIERVEAYVDGHGALTTCSSRAPAPEAPASGALARSNTGHSTTPHFARQAKSGPP
jgi:hypothetical protein